MSGNTRYYIACSVSLAISLAALALPFLSSRPDGSSAEVATAGPSSGIEAKLAAQCEQQPANNRAAEPVFEACLRAGMTSSFAPAERKKLLLRHLELSKEFNLWSESPDVPEMLETLAELDPGNVDVKLMIAQSAVMTTRYDRAITIVNEVLEQDPNNGIARLIRGQSMFMLDQSFVVLDDLLLAAKLMPDRPEPLMAIGQALQQRLGRPDEAADYYARAMAMKVEIGRLSDIPLYGLNERPVDALSGLLPQLNDVKTAEKLFASLLESLSPDDRSRVNILQQKFRLYEKAGDAAKMIVAIDELLAVQSPETHAGLLLQRGFLKLAMKQFDEARADIERAMLEEKLNMVLRLQVMLRNAGQLQVKINGKYDKATKVALDRCLVNPACGSDLPIPL